MTRAVLFLVFSMVLAWISRASLTDPRSHGFYRFFAWECILGLVLLNFRSIDQWFGDPFSPHQIVSWFLMFASIVPVVDGVRLLRTHGRPDAARSADEALMTFEKTTRLVTTGIYRYVRHPLYSSLLLLAWGVFFKHPSWLGSGLAAGATVFLQATAKVEEAENVDYFGPAYRDYMQKTRMFIPFLF